MSRVKTICIVGNGSAAIEAIRAMRENDFTGEIHLFSNSKWPSYNPMLTTYYVAGIIDFAALFPFGYNMDFYEQYNVQMHMGSPVVKLDAEKKTIINEAGSSWEYDSCFVATGASPIIPSFQGLKNTRVFTMRTVEDALSLRQALKEVPQKALVVGASMVGIKIVELLHNVGVEVCLADLAPHIFPLAAHPDCAGIIEKRLVEKGIKLRLGAGIQGIEEHSHGVRAYFSGSSDPEEANLVVLCIGVRPNLGFIDKEQVEIDRGILVDDYMRTSNPALFAAGDVAQGKNLLTGEKQIIGLLASARYQGRTAGRNMAGREDVYTGNIPHNITHFMDMVFAGLGDLRNGSKEEVLREKDSYIHLVWDRERLVGVNMLDNCEGSGIIINALHKSLITNTPLNNDNLSWNKLIESIYLKLFNRKGIKNLIL